MEGRNGSLPMQLLQQIVQFPYRHSVRFKKDNDIGVDGVPPFTCSSSVHWCLPRETTEMTRKWALIGSRRSFRSLMGHTGRNHAERSNMAG